MPEGEEWAGPLHRWFAWHPVDTQDRGWRWLRMVWRRRVTFEVDMRGTLRYFRHSVAKPRA